MHCLCGDGDGPDCSVYRPGKRAALPGEDVYGTYLLSDCNLNPKYLFDCSHSFCVRYGRIWCTPAGGVPASSVADDGWRGHGSDAFYDAFGIRAVRLLCHGDGGKEQKQCGSYGGDGRIYADLPDCQCAGEVPLLG